MVLLTQRKLIEATPLIFLLLFFFSASHAQNKAEKIVQLAQKQLGKPYLFAGKSPQTGFDCSGLVYYVFTEFHYNVPRSSSEYRNFGKKIPVNRARKGDIILFTGYRDSLRIGHVGIITDVNGENITFIHASSGKKHPGVISTELQESFYKKRFVGIVRVINE